MTYPLDLTQNAVSHISQILSEEAPDSFFRILVKGGGCSGFSYEFKVDHNTNNTNNTNNGDIVIPCGNYRVLIDDISIAFLKGSQLDYVVQMIGSQFEIKNPNAKSSCGCGVSFSV